MTLHRHHKTYSTKQQQGTNGRLACLECQHDITEKRRKTFCSEVCADQFRLKTSSSEVRRQVYQRDKGVCSLCGFDTMAGHHFSKRHNGNGSGHLWQADHIVPVIEGGGECSLDNFRTLCTACHKKVTAELTERRRLLRRKEVFTGTPPAYEKF